jgi:3-oxoacyl-[acyl-carrier-protein] synthase-3
MSKNFNSRIIATGSYLPAKILTNEDLSKMVDTTDAWIVERTGIKKRHIAADGQLTSDIACLAAENALKKAGIGADKIEMIIVATTTPDLTFPSTATIVQSKLKAKNAFAFDVQAVCSGFVYALNIADNFIKSGQVKNALVIGADTLSRIIDWTDRSTCVLFSDGAGAVIIEAIEDKNKGILAAKLYSDGDSCDILKTSGGVGFNQKAGHIQMAGKEVFRHAVEKMAKSINEILVNAKMTIADVDWLVPHQANIRILDMVASRLDLDKEKVIITLDQQGNTSAATIPLALDYSVSDGRIKADDIVVLEALGGGLTWGTILIRW